MATEIVNALEVHIEEKRVLRLLGYKEGYPLTGLISSILKAEIEEGYGLIAPIAVYRLLEIKGMDGTTIRLGEGVALTPAKAGEEWKGCTYLAMALCTIGLELENRVASLFAEGEYAPALILDSVGSVAAEALSDYVNFLVCSKAREMGLGAGPRASPGYGGWDLSDQRFFTTLLPVDKIGVSLTEQWMMVPRKSVSFCAGIGRGLAAETSGRSCHRCGMLSCHYREQPFSTVEGRNIVRQKGGY